MRQAVAGLPCGGFSLRCVVATGSRVPVWLLMRYNMNISYTHHRLENGLDVLDPRGSRLSDRRGQRLVSRGIEERDARAHGLCAPVRAPDVRGLGALRPRLLPAAAGGRGAVERVDERRPHELLGGRAAQRARAGAVDGIRSDGISAARADGREVREPARGRAERAAAELREPAVRLRGHGARRRVVCRRTIRITG